MGPDKEWLREGASFLASIQGEDDLGAIVRAHLFIESELLKLIAQGLAKLGAVNLTVVNFPVKVGLAIALGSVPVGLQKALLKVNALRNKMAHNFHAQVTRADAQELFESLPTNERLIMGSEGSLRVLSFVSLWAAEWFEASIDFPDPAKLKRKCLVPLASTGCLSDFAPASRNLLKMAFKDIDPAVAFQRLFSCTGPLCRPGRCRQAMSTQYHRANWALYSSVVS